MKKLIVCFCAFLTMATFHDKASAMTYTNANADLLLIFRQSGFNDVEFNLGSVSNFLNLAPGSVTTVANFDLSIVLANNNGGLGGVDFVLLSCTPFVGGAANNTSWLTDADPSSNPLEITGSKMSLQCSAISSVGTEAAVNTGSSATESFTPDPSSPDSYDYLVSNGGQLDASRLGGAADFTVEQSIPGASRFFQIGTSTALVKPPAAQIGNFNVDTNGVLTFIAGAVVFPPPQPALSATRGGTLTSISFVTTSLVKYQLYSSTSITNSLSTWTPVGAPVVGNGSSAVLQDNTGVAATFYTVKAYYQ